MEAVESNNDILSTGQQFFDNSNTSRVTYLNEHLMKMVDHSFKMGKTAIFSFLRPLKIWGIILMKTVQESNMIRFM